MAKAIDEPRDFLGDDSLEGQVKEYAYLKGVVDEAEKRQKTLKEKLFAYIEENGFEDGKGHWWYEFTEPIDGVNSVQKEKRVSRTKIDDLVADNIIEKKNLADRLYKTVRVVDQDALWAALYEGVLTEEEVDAIFPPKVVWALKLSKK